MKRIVRLIGLFAIFLFLFMVAVLVSQQLLRKHTARLREEAIEQKRAQLVAAIEAARLAPPPWADDVHRRLERTIDASVRPLDPAATDRPGAPSAWRFVHTFGDGPGAAAVEVEFTPAPALRLIDIFQRVATALLILALCLIFVAGAFLLGPGRSREPIGEAEASGAGSDRAGLQSLTQLASVSARQSDELERERAERLRIEENLHIQQLLLNRALEEKIRLGQDLHDGIIQSLYATGLTLEATRDLVATDTAAAATRIADSTRALNQTIREVRAYINGLSPDTLHRQTFGDAIAVLTRELAADRTVGFERAIDEELARSLDPDTATDLLQVVREAVSNSLRHGRASRIAISLARNDSRCELRITDDGAGFSVDAAVAASGHGLENIRARVQRRGGAIAIESAPGRGTTIRCELPVPTPSHA